MIDNTLVQRVVREAVVAARDSGIMQQEIEHSALATLQVEMRAGRYEVDLEKAILGEIRRAIETDGRAADGIIRRMANGDVPLTYEDLDVIVILGGGLRKSWGAVTPDDLVAMNEIRYRNFKSARDSFQEFNSNVMSVRSRFEGFETVAEAFEAGAFSARRAA